MPRLWLLQCEAFPRKLCPCRTVSSNDANRIKIQKTLNKEKTRKNINLNFITLDISPDSKEGKTLSQQFEINSYPAFIIINRDGTLNRKIMGIIEDNTLVKQIMSNQ